MTKKTIIGFVVVSLSLVACVAPGDEESTGDVGQALIKDTPGSGESCHVEGAGITNGTMTSSGWCCGVSTCLDKETCGSEYGHQVSSCAACDWYKCDPGATKIGVKHPFENLFTSGGRLVVASGNDDNNFTAPYTPAVPKRPTTRR